MSDLITITVEEEDMYYVCFYAKKYISSYQRQEGFNLDAIKRIEKAIASARIYSCVVLDDALTGTREEIQEKVLK